MKRVFSFVIAILLVITTACSKETPIEQDVEKEDEPVVIDEPIVIEDDYVPKIYAFFGVDSRNNSYGIGTRADSIMLVSVNDKEKTVKVCSIIRDTLFHIEGHEYEKVTHAHSYGGPKLAISTINENLDLNVEKYLTVNFNSFKELVDQMGGVEIEINESEVKTLKNIEGKFCGYIYSAGKYNLDGAQALAYSRERHTDGGDVRRSERQRTVLFALFEKAQIMSTEDKLNIATLMLNTISTNLLDDEALRLVSDIQDYEIIEMASYPQVFYAGLIHYSYGDRYVEIPFYLTDMAKEVHEYLGLPYDGASETLQKYSDHVASIVDGPNTDIRNAWGNHE